MIGHSFTQRTLAACGVAAATFAFGANALAGDETYYGQALVSAEDSEAINRTSDFAEMLFIDRADNVVGVLRLDSIVSKGGLVLWSLTASAEDYGAYTERAQYALIETDTASVFWEIQMDPKNEKLQIVAANQTTGVMDENPWEDFVFDENPWED